MTSCKEGKQQLITIHISFPSEVPVWDLRRERYQHPTPSNLSATCGRLTASPIGHIRTWDRPREGSGDAEAAPSTAGSKTNKE